MATKYAYVKFDSGVFEGVSVTDTTFSSKQTGAFGSGSLTTANCYGSIKDALTYGSLADDDFIYISDSHNNVSTSAYTKTITVDLQIASVSDTNCDQYSEGATEGSSYNGTTSLLSSTAKTRFIGITIVSFKDIAIGGLEANIRFTNCTFFITLAATGYKITIEGDGCNVIWKDCTLNLNHIWHYLNMTSGNHLEIDNLKAHADHVISTRHLIDVGSGGGTNWHIKNTDFTKLFSTVLFDAPLESEDSLYATLHRCKIDPDKILESGSALRNISIDYNSCDVGDGYHSFGSLGAEGTQASENTLIYLSYAYDDTNKSSVVMESQSNISVGNPLRVKIAEYPAQDLTSANTYTVNFVTTDATSAVHLADTMFWIEAERNDATDMALGVNQSSRATDNSDDILAGDVTTDGATEHDAYTGTPTWTGLSTDSNKYEDSLTVSGMTGVDNGTVTIYACLAEPNIDVYVCPLPVIT